MTSFHHSLITTGKKYAKLSSQKKPSDATGKRDVLLEACMYALQQSCTADVVCDGFRRAGLVPFDPESALANVCVANLRLSPEELAGLEEARQRRRRNNIGIGGGILLPGELKARWEAREQRQAARGRAIHHHGRARGGRVRHPVSSYEVTITHVFMSVSYVFITGRVAKRFASCYPSSSQS